MQTNPASSRQPIKLTLRSLGLIGLLGGLAGAIVWSCYGIIPLVFGPAFTAGLPGLAVEFGWFLISVGAIHGGVLALASVGLAIACWDQKPPIPWITLFAVGWIASWLSFIPMVFYWDYSPDSDVHAQLIQAINWPFKEESFGFTPQPWWGLVQPYLLCGVGFWYYFLLNICGLLQAKSLQGQVMAAVVSTSLGFALWGYPGVLFGAIWGSLVGFGVWKSQQPNPH